MIKIELSFTTVAEAAAFLSAGQSATGYAPDTGVLPVPVPKPVATPTAPAQSKAAKTETAAASPSSKAVAADPTPATTPVATPAASSPTAAVAVADVPEKKEPVSQKQLDYATDVSPKIATAAKHNRAAVVAALSKFGVAKGTELKPEQWPEFVATMDAILAV